MFTLSRQGKTALGVDSTAEHILLYSANTGWLALQRREALELVLAMFSEEELINHFNNRALLKAVAADRHTEIWVKHADQTIDLEKYGG